jgi:hypothetical protein
VKASWIFSFAIVAALSACSASTTRDDNSVGSGADGGTGNTGSGGIGAVGGSSGVGGSIIVDDGGGDEPLDCGGETFPLVRKPAKILLVLDRSGSMKDPPDGSSSATPKWDLTVPAVNEVITNTNAQVAWGLKTFPETSVCQVTDAIDVPVAANNAGAVTGAVSATTPEGDGTPTGDAMNAAVKYLQTLDAAGDTDQKYILLATDGEPSCVGGSEQSQATSRPYAVQAVKDAVTAGYHTFVVGVATTKTSATQALNDMAVAGEEARPDPNPLATKFYLANTKDELVTALSAITGVVLDCRFELSQLPDAGEHVGVRIGGETVPPDAWEFTGTDKKTVEVLGEWCDRIKSGQTDVVRIVFGCPTDPVF